MSIFELIPVYTNRKTKQDGGQGGQVWCVVIFTRKIVRMPSDYYTNRGTHGQTG